VAEDQGGNKDELLRSISEAEAEGLRLERLGREAQHGGRFVVDFAQVARDAYSSASPDVVSSVNLDDQIGSWRSLTQSLRGAADGLGSNVRTVYSATMGTMNSTSSMFWVMSAEPVLANLGFQDARQRYFRLREIPSLIEDIRSSMKRLGLTSPAFSQRSPLDLLEESEAVLNRPPVRDGRPTSTLIPLRGAIERTFAVLLSRRPRQEGDSKKWSGKVRSIGSQCCRSGFSIDDLNRLVDTADALNVDLSGAKEDEMTREQQRELFYRGLVFLDTFLLDIDEKRLRPAR
jgi:hypothetical protein